ncbi:MAG: Crp/Fnr family transcriptional regulator [Saprospiraceae bacterium]|nr:Crp/Fnr family transcriptional regulator [Saprospiraceae bacterium]
MFDHFWQFTNQFVHFSPKERAQISTQLILRDIPKQHVLVDFGDVAREVYFVNKGLLRFYYIADDGREITGFVFQEGMMAGSHESFFGQQPSLQVLESIEAAELFVLGHESLEQLYREVPKMNIFVRKLLEQRMAHAQKVVASLIMQKPADRYQEYQRLHPGLAGRIPQHMLATFMGITPVSLSRIRGRRK